METENRRLYGRKLLDELAEYLNQRDTSAHHMWMILSGLRGPDSEHITLKSETTSKLRNAFGLEPGGTYAVVSAFKPEPNDVPAHYSYAAEREAIGNIVKRLKTTVPTISDDRVQYHFLFHYMKALHGLRYFEKL